MRNRDDIRGGVRPVRVGLLALVVWVAGSLSARSACDPDRLQYGDTAYWQHENQPGEKRSVYRGTSTRDRIMRIQVYLFAGQNYVFSLCPADGGATYGGGGDAVLNLCRGVNGAPGPVVARGDNECGNGPRLTYRAETTGQSWVAITARDCESFGDGNFTLVYWRDSCVKAIRQASDDTSAVAITDAAGYGGTATLVARDEGAFVPYVVSCDSHHAGAWRWGSAKVKITFHDGTVRWAEHVANEGGRGLWRLERGSPFRRDYSKYRFAGWKRQLRAEEPTALRHYTRVGNSLLQPVARLYAADGVLKGTGTVVNFDGPGEAEWIGTGASGSSLRDPGLGRVLAIVYGANDGHAAWTCEGQVVLNDRVLATPFGDAFSDPRLLGPGDSAGRQGGRY